MAVINTIFISHFFYLEASSDFHEILLLSPFPWKSLMEGWWKNSDCGTEIWDLVSLIEFKVHSPRQGIIKSMLAPLTALYLPARMISLAYYLSLLNSSGSFISDIFLTVSVERSKKHMVFQVACFILFVLSFLFLYTFNNLHVPAPTHTHFVTIHAHINWYTHSHVLLKSWKPKVQN